MAFNAVIGSLRAVLGLDSAAFEAGLGKAQRQLRGFGRDVERIGKQISDVGKTMTLALTVPILGFGAATTKAAGSYEAAMIRVQAATGATTKQMDALNAKALEISQGGLGVSMAQTAEAMEALAKNGLDVDQILAGAAQKAAVLAKANNAELGPAADAVTDIMNNFGVAAGDLGKVIDGVTGTTVQSKFDFDNYRQALGQAGGVAGQLGVTFIDFNASLAATSSAFSSGSDAGTSFKTFLQRLVPQSKEAAGMIKALGLEFYDAQGRMLPMAQIAQNLQDKLKGLNDEAKSQALTTIFGADAVRTALLLAKAGADGIDRYKKLIGDTSAEAMAMKMTQGWEGAIKDMSAAILELQVAIANSGLLKWLTDAIRSVTSWVREMAAASPETLKWTTIIAGVTAALGPMIAIMGTAVTHVGGLIKAFASLWPVIGAGLIAIGPTGWLIVGLTAAAGLILGFANSADTAKSASEKLSESLKRLRGETDSGSTSSREAAEAKRDEAKAYLEAAQAAAAEAATKARIAAAPVRSRSGGIMASGVTDQDVASAARSRTGEILDSRIRAYAEAKKEADVAAAQIAEAEKILADVGTQIGMFNQGQRSGGRPATPPPPPPPLSSLPAAQNDGQSDGQRKKELEQADAMLEDWREFQRLAAERLDSQNESTERAEYELSLLGKSADEQERLLALFDKRNDLARTYGDITGDNARAELRSYEQQLDAQAQLRATNRTYREIGDFGERAFDRIGSAATEAAVSGGDAGIDLGSIWKGVLSELMQEFIRLALLNPLKNLLGIGGGNLDTMSTVIQGLGSIASGFFGGGTEYAVNANPTSYGGPRASGGRVNPGQWYMTGEKGPEPFMPDSPGRIIPTKDMVAANGNGATFNNTVNVSGNGVTEAQVRRALEENNKIVGRNLERTWGARSSNYNALRG